MRNFLSSSKVGVEGGGAEDWSGVAGREGVSLAKAFGDLMAGESERLVQDDRAGLGLVRWPLAIIGATSWGEECVALATGAKSEAMPRLMVVDDSAEAGVGLIGAAKGASGWTGR